MSPNSRDVIDRIEKHKDEYLEQLKAYLRIPSVSTDPAYEGDVARCCDFVVEQLTAAGLRARQIQTQRHPLAYGEWSDAPGKPTLLFYGHYDVQPPDPLELWRNPPFEPAVEGDALVARGATDDKGQSFAHLKAVEAMLAVRGELPVNVKFLIEGEEESGGESIDKFVREDGGTTLGCDCVVISDGDMYAPGQPSLLYGLKGAVNAEIRLVGPNRDLHSGAFGGAVTNPCNALGQIVAQLRDAESGRVLIPGFYDDVRPLEEWERQEFAKLPFDEGAYAQSLGVSELFGEEGYTTLERVWTRPTCDVTGIYGGYQGAGAKTVLPSRAGAKVSMRLVPDQQPSRIAALLRSYVEEVAPPGVQVEVEYLGGADPVLLDTEGPFVEAVSEAQGEIWGRRPVRIRDGGSLPIVSTFSDVLRAPILLVGFGLPDDQPHAPNEKFNLSHFYNGIKTIVRLIDRSQHLTSG